MNEVTILNTVFTVKTSELDTVTSPEKRKEKNISGFSVHTISDS